ncbi:1,4-dihydroxy-2-naphthoate octaprenyltransferase [Blattabacterium cuenoti]|uniref:1,4-dihydroxy-2-naphthoate octaprenyltransferase n=1 Tax=Blattabacterium cuenoti TaxID=1653831 RepID=UPI00163C4B2F|nr:1,4-dihydroxy-2-naphthoate octaprenyltransferase [Blattabacterium cuenoti]
MKIKYWLYAFRCYTLPLSISGITSSYLYVKNNFFYKKINIFTYVLCLLTSIFLQILSNLSNDYGDYKKGIDSSSYKKTKNVIQRRFFTKNEIKKSIYIFSLLSFISGLLLIYKTLLLNMSIFYFIFYLLGLIICIYSSISYSIGISYGWITGLGDLSVLIFFGIVPVTSSYFLYTYIFPSIDIILISLSVGLLNVSVLNINNIRDIKNDFLHGKKTIANFFHIRYAVLYQALILSISICINFYFFIKNKKNIYQWIILIFISIFLLKHINNIILPIKSKKKLSIELKKMILITLIHAINIGY